jgi:hypothetical protein
MQKGISFAGGTLTLADELFQNSRACLELFELVIHLIVAVSTEPENHPHDPINQTK